MFIVTEEAAAAGTRVPRTIAGWQPLPMQPVKQGPVSRRATSSSDQP
jgi:hypothetical protein